MTQISFNIDNLSSMEDETLRFIASKILLEKAKREREITEGVSVGPDIDVDQYMKG